MITQEELKEKLRYDADTGEWSRRGHVAKGNWLVKQVGNLQTNGYIRIVLKGKKYYAHRLAWLYVYGEFPIGNVDHVDGNRSNNKLNNLRVCNQSQNMWNIGVSSHNTSGYKGVSQYGANGKWMAYCWINNVRKYLGVYNTSEAASDAYKEFAKANHGEFYKETNV